MNPFVTAYEVANHLKAQEIQPEGAETYFYGQIASTLTHELGHQDSRTHDEAFAGAYTRIQGRLFEEFNAMVKALDKEFRQKGQSLYAQVVEDYAKIVEPAYRAVTRDDIFGKISTRSSGDRVAPGDRGDPSRGEGRGAGLQEALPPGGESAPGVVAASAAAPEDLSRALTPEQRQLAKLIGQDIQLRAALKKAQANARIAYKLGTTDAIARAKAELRDVLLKARIKAEAFGLGEGFKLAEKLTRKEFRSVFKEREQTLKQAQEARRREMIAAFRDSQKSAEESRKALRDVIEAELPLEERGKFLDALVGRITKKKQLRILERVEQLQEKLNRKALIEELGELQTFKGDIPVEYQRRLKEIVGDINTKNFTAATIRKLEGLKAWSDQHGMPSGVNPRTLEKLRRLKGKQAKDMTSEELASPSASA